MNVIEFTGNKVKEAAKIYSNLLIWHSKGRLKSYEIEVLESLTGAVSSEKFVQVFDTDCNYHINIRYAKYKPIIAQRAIEHLRNDAELEF